MLRKNSLRVFSFTAILLHQVTFSGVCFAASTDELIGRASNVVTTLARGNVSGAAYQAIGGYNVPITRQSSIYASPSQVGFQQSIKPLGVYDPAINAATTYQAAVNPLRPTQVAQSVQVNSGNPYFSNTTTIPVPANIKRE